MSKILNFLASLATLVLLSGCNARSNSPKPIYYWDSSYAKSTYDYLNNEGDINEQISNLEQIAQKAYQKGAKIPPGLYAQLGLLYSNLGDSTQAKSYFEKEILAFPESRAYIEFLLSQKGYKK